MICRRCDVSSTEPACWVCGKPTTAGNLLTPVIPQQIVVPRIPIWPSLRRNR